MMSTLSKKMKFYKEKTNCEAVEIVAGGLRGVTGEGGGLMGWGVLRAYLIR